MRPRSIPEFAKKMNEYFKIRNGHTFLDPLLMKCTGKIELDILKLDDLLHERHGNYEDDGKNMGDITIQEYGVMANAFVRSLIIEEVTS